MAGTRTGRQAFRSRVNSVEAQPKVVTTSQQLMLSVAPRAMPAPMHRLGRGTPPEPLYGKTAAGNSTVSSDVRGQPAAQPGKGAGKGIANAYPFPTRFILTPPSQLGRQARTGATTQHDRLVARDRRVTGRRGTVMLSGLPDSKPGFPDPDADGPARPGFEQINRTLSKQVGTDSTANLDNTAPKPKTTAGRQPFALGTRGDPQTRIYGGTPGLAAFRPYGYRGFPAGTAAPRPAVYALSGGQYRRGTLLADGDPADGPQKFASGPPWGLHTLTVPPPVLTNAVQRQRFSQIRKPRLNRPLNSRAQGQSFSQSFVGQDGRRAVRIPRANPGRQPGLNGWRAQ